MRLFSEGFCISPPTNEDPMRLPSRSLVVPLLIGYLALLPGCGGGGEKRIPVTGRIHKAGQVLPVNALKGGRLDVMLVPMDEAQFSKTGAESVELNPDDGTFTV